MGCSGCGHSSSNCTCRRCKTCQRKYKDCKCGRDVELQPRPSRRPAESGPRIVSVPEGVRTNQPYIPRRDGSSAGGTSIEAASYSSTGSARVDNSAFNARTSTSSSSTGGRYTYKDRTDPVYANTGPEYDSSSNVLSSAHRKIVDDTKAGGYDDLARRFETQARIGNKVSGNHKDVPTYGRDGLYRTASDMEGHDSYKRDQKRLEDAKSPYAAASQLAPRQQKFTDPQRHLDVANIHQGIGDAHRRISSGRMEYMETQPGGLADAGSFRTHVKAAGDGLIGMNSAYTNRDRERDVARQKQLAQQSGAWDQNPYAGGDYLDRPGSGSTLHSSNSSKVSSSKSAKAFADGKSVKRQCEHISRRDGRRCTNMTSDPGRRCRDHR